MLRPAQLGTVSEDGRRKNEETKRPSKERKWDQGTQGLVDLECQKPGRHPVYWEYTAQGKKKKKKCDQRGGALDISCQKHEVLLAG